MHDFDSQQTQVGEIKSTCDRISSIIGFVHPSKPQFFGGELSLLFEFVDQPHLSWPI